MNDDLPRPAPYRIWTRALAAAALLGAAVLAVSSSASAFGFGGHFGAGAMRHVPGGPAQFHPRTHAWPMRGPAAPRDSWPRQRHWPRTHWPSIPGTPTDPRVVRDGGSGPMGPPPVCPANSYLVGSPTKGWSCHCDPGFDSWVGRCFGPVVCPPHSHSDPGGRCICDAGYVPGGPGPYPPSRPNYCVRQPPPCGLPQCPSSDGGGPSSVGDVPQKPERAQ